MRDKQEQRIENLQKKLLHLEKENASRLHDKGRTSALF